MKRIKTKNAPPLDDEEKILMEAENSYEPLAKSQLKTMKARLIDAANNTNVNRKLVSLRIREDDLECLKHEAQAKGLGYQTLINSILHQYVTGHMKAS